MPITWSPETFYKLREAIDAKGITLEQAVDAINKVGVEKSCWTCKFRALFSGKCSECIEFSNHEVKL
jgi:hypothetical protein